MVPFTVACMSSWGLYVAIVVLLGIYYFVGFGMRDAVRSAHGTQGPRDSIWPIQPKNCSHSHRAHLSAHTKAQALPQEPGCHRKLFFSPLVHTTEQPKIPVVYNDQNAVPASHRVEVPSSRSGDLSNSLTAGHEKCKQGPMTNVE
jgi:hypothetical protein